MDRHDAWNHGSHFVTMKRIGLIQNREIKGTCVSNDISEEVNLPFLEVLE